MRLNRCLPALALLVFLPARADEAAAKAASAGAKAEEKKMSCCAGEEGAEKALCPKGKDKSKEKTKAAAKKTAPQPKAAAAAPEKQTAAAPAPGAANMVVTRDPVTGELRNATPEERARLFAGRTPQAAPAEPVVVTLPDGTQMVKLGEESMSYAVATKAPDGTLQQTCVHGADAAAEARKARTPAPAPRAEER